MGTTPNRRGPAKKSADSSVLFNHTFLSKCGKIGALIDTHDWAKTSIGIIEQWPPALRVTVNIMLQSPLPMVLLWGSDGVMIYNDAYSVFAGARHPSLLGSKVLDGWPEVADFNKHVMEMVFHKGKTLSYHDQELTLYRDGQAEQVWMDLNYSPVMDKNGKPDGVLAIVTETTKRVQAEQKQLEAEQKLQTEQKRLYDLFMNAPAAISMTTGPDLVFTLANDPYMQLVGKDRQLLGRPLVEALPEVEPDLLAIVKNVAFKGERFVADELPVTLDWDNKGMPYTKYLNFVYEPIFEAGKPDGMMAFAFDVTEQVKARQRIEESEKRFRELADTAPMYIAMADETGNAVYFNKPWLEFTGKKLEEMVGMGWLSVLHPADAPKFEADFKNAFEKQVPINEQYRFKRADKKYRWMLAVGAPRLTAKGKFVGYYGTYTDFHEVKMAEREHERLRSVTLQRNELQRLNRAKDEFISLASHQLRTPATAVKQYVGLLMDGYAGPLTDEQREYLKTAHDSNERQLHIINDLLRTAQLDATDYKLRQEKQDIVEIIREVITDFKSSAELKAQKIEFHCSDDGLQAMVDSTEIKLVFMNLLENASKYSHEGGKITVTLEQKDDQILISTTDQGVGIKDVDKERIFDKFTRVQNELTDSVPGTGLGLYWVKQIVAMHKGNISVDSQPGKGSTFIVSLPL